jgi:hypothetical protein
MDSVLKRYFQFLKIVAYFSMYVAEKESLNKWRISTNNMQQSLLIAVLS